MISFNLPPPLAQAVNPTNASWWNVQFKAGISSSGDSYVGWTSKYPPTLVGGIPTVVDGIPTVVGGIRETF